MDNLILTQPLQTMLPCLRIVVTTPLTLLTTVSAGLFQDTARFCNLNDILLPALAVMAIFNILFIHHTVTDRIKHKSFSCDFIFSLGISVSFIIGTIYSLTNQRNILEETLFKIIFTFLLAKIVDAFSFKFNQPVQGTCSVCLEELGKEVIVLKCCHILH